MKADAPILVVGQGDPNAPDTWSGIPRYVVGALAAGGRTVRTADVECTPFGLLISKVATAVPNRRRWAARHHYGPVGFWMRSRRARRSLRAHTLGPVLQFGGQFCSFASPDPRYFCYCDSNALFGADSPYPKRNSAMSKAELQAMITRERHVYSRARTIFTFSDALKRSFVDGFGIRAERVVTVFAGANLDTLPGERSDPDVNRPPTILFVGREFARKGGPQLVDAFRKVRQFHPTARLVIAGADPRLDEVTGVEVRGFIERTPAGRTMLSTLYRSADIFCMPSLYEAFGIVFAEAMLHGLPCVGSRTCAIPEIIEDGVTGWLVPPGDTDALAGVLTRALSDRATLRRMGDAARADATRRFTWPRVVARMCEHMFAD